MSDSNENFKWVGIKTVTPGKRKWKINHEGITVIAEYNGPASALLTSGLLYGGGMQEFENYGLRVSDIDIEQLDGGAGQMTVTLTSPTVPEQFGFQTPVAIGDPVFEIEWEELTLAIQSHPRCGTLTSAAGPLKIGWDDFNEIEANSEAYSGIGDGKWDYHQYAAIRRSGTDSFFAAQPIVHRTTFWTKQPPTPGDIYHIQNPPIDSGAPEGYQWLKGPVRVRQTSKIWEMDESWRGADTWDELIYPHAGV